MKIVPQTLSFCFFSWIFEHVVETRPCKQTVNCLGFVKFWKGKHLLFRWSERKPEYKEVVCVKYLRMILVIELFVFVIKFPNFLQNSVKFNFMRKMGTYVSLIASENYISHFKTMKTCASQYTGWRRKCRI